MGIADIFEALTAKDRPYKEGKTLTESLAILGKFKLNGHIDPDLFDVFIREKVYLNYARQFLKPEQIDEVDLSKIPEYRVDRLAWTVVSFRVTCEHEVAPPPVCRRCLFELHRAEECENRQQSRWPVSTAFSR